MRFRGSSSILLFSILAAICAVSASADKPRIEQASSELSVTQVFSVEYLLAQPDDYTTSDSTRTWPLIVFLHGAGERAIEVRDLRDYGPNAYLTRSEIQNPFFVLSPHCPMEQDWSPVMLEALLERICNRFPIDAERIYLTGYSMGGHGTWETAIEYPARFAAIAPLCGRVIPLLAFRLWRMPVWVHHGEADTVVPLQASLEMTEILENMGNENARLTTYPGVGHEIWGDVYRNPELYDWLLSHTLSSRGDSGGE